ncbi:MAG: MerR family transcriptional regulator [Acidimicrobiales bacterium]
MGERSYLSIGDVLALLRAEFPDITISKIRFLESRGLLVPERTPSGYRKFYDHDVDRLAWILRQQREHFLPLKVIKGRLEGAESARHPESLFDPAEAPPAGMIAPELPKTSARMAANGAAHPSAGGRPGDSEHAAARVATLPRDAATGERDDVAAVREIVPSRVAGGDAVPELRRRLAGASSTAEDPRTAAMEPRGARTRGHAARAGDDLQPGEATAGREPSEEVAAAPPATKPEAQGANTTARVRSGGGGPTITKRPAARVPEGATSIASGVSLTVGELSQASGLTVAQVEELESFGLIEGRTVAGVHCFDEEAVAVAAVAAGFAHYGVEARHLRIFKHAAERQASLYSQVVMPLLRQRNPEARARAHDDLQKMSELGTSLQSCFSRASFRDLTGG